VELALYLSQMHKYMNVCMHLAGRERSFNQNGWIDSSSESYMNLSTYSLEFDLRNNAMHTIIIIIKGNRGEFRTLLLHLPPLQSPQLILVHSSFSLQPP
jgi:hypothetical protein